LLRQQERNILRTTFGLDKTEQKFGSNVLQIHNARADAKAPLLAPMGLARRGTALYKER
jgi:hypothetical protein